MSIVSPDIAKKILGYIPNQHRNTAEVSMKNKTIIAAGVFLGLLGVVLVAYLVLPIAVSTLLTMGGREQIHCWVKVVNQEGKGVDEYKFRMIEEGGSWPFIWRSRDAIRIFKTGHDGTLEYKSLGPVGRVFIGYDFWYHWRINPEHLMESNIFAVTSYEFRKAIHENPSKYLGSKENPYLVHVFCVGSPQKLLYWKQRVNLKNPDAYTCIDLLEGRIWESDKPEGDIAMKDGKYTKEKAPSCDIYIMAGDNCLLYPVVDDWGLEAPKEGYTSKLCWGKDWYSKRTSTINIHQLYYMIHSPKADKYIYGRISLGGSPRVQGALLENYTNLQGERNLFYKGYVRDYNPLPGPIQDYISPPVSLPLEKPSKAKPSEAK